MRITYCEKLLCEKSRQNYAVSWQRRDLEIGMPGVEFRLEGRAGSSFLVGKRGNREARRRRTRQRRVNATYIPDGSDPSRGSLRTERGILVYRAAPAEDFRSIKVTSISCLIRSRSKNRRDAPRDSLFIAWRLINGSVQMSALHIFFFTILRTLNIYIYIWLCVTDPRSG